MIRMRRSQGAVLFIALIILVAMSLAGIALMRRVDTANVIANNLAFRQAATHSGDIGVEAARTWLLNVTTASDLFNSNPALANGQGYFADWAASLDLLGNLTTSTADDFDWTGPNAIDVTVPAPPAGYSVKYVIHRLCPPGTTDPTSGACIRQVGALGATASGTKGAAVYGSYAISGTVTALYRITVRVQGPRNTISYIQAVVS